jgi:hypothetical protein
MYHVVYTEFYDIKKFIHKLLKPRKLAKAISLLTCTSEEPGSNIIRDIIYTD